MSNTPSTDAAATIDKEVMAYFIEESMELLEELQNLGGALKGVGVPTPEDSCQLSEFAQKLNRLIGGTASVGFTHFSPLSRKTSLLAEKCAEIREMPIRILIANLNTVISVLWSCFSDMATVKEVESIIPDIEKRIDMCMAAVGVQQPEVKSQCEIDDLLAAFDL